jgi:hypothetical protein
MQHILRKFNTARKEHGQDRWIKHELSNISVILKKINRELELEYFLTLLR